LAFSDKDITINQYHEKGEVVVGDYHFIKKSFTVDRGEVWTPRNKRPSRLRDNIKMLEELLRSEEVLFVKWKQTSILKVSDKYVCNFLLQVLTADSMSSESKTIKVKAYEISEIVFVLLQVTDSYLFH